VDEPDFGSDINATGAIAVTKLDAARRQLRTAIELWFNDGDPIAIHTLAYAAHEIIHRLFRKRGLSDLFYDSTIIKEDKRREFALEMKKPANFFKHADKESETESLAFQPVINTVFIVMSLIGLDQMKVSRGPLEAAFMFWHQVHIPVWFSEDVSDYPIPPDSLEHLRSLNRAQFLEGFQEFWRQRRG
jgi:hypothetical protein